MTTSSAPPETTPDEAVPGTPDFAHVAADKIGAAAEMVGPYAQVAKQRSARVAHDAVERLGPVLEDALDKVPPAVEAAKAKMHDEVLPKLVEALAAAAALPIAAEIAEGGPVEGISVEAAVARPKRRWLKRLAIIVVIGGIAVIVARKLLGSSDTDWQAARPTAPYVPKPAEPAASAANTWSAATDSTAATASTAEGQDQGSADEAAESAAAPAEDEGAADEVEADSEDSDEGEESEGEESEGEEESASGDNQASTDDAK